MELVIRHEKFLVFDHVLDKKEFNDLWVHCQNDDYKSAHNLYWNKVWRLGDGAPLVGTQFYSSQDSEFIKSTLQPDRKMKYEYKFYPTETALDNLYLKLLDLNKNFVDIVGSHGKEWCDMILVPFLHPSGSGLSWHQDKV